jgi:GTPase SAR1 family protein
MSYKEGPMQESPLSFKIILLGDSGTLPPIADIGKTCFINQFIKN